MDLMDICRAQYATTIKNAQIDPGLRKALRTHERVPTFIDNLAKEFRSAEKNGIKLTRELIEEAVHDMTLMFVLLATRKAEEKLMSPLALASKKAKHDAAAQLQVEADLLASDRGKLVIEKVKGEDVLHVEEIKRPESQAD